jgi:hypothetical protein
MFQSPARATRLEGHGITTQFVNAHLHGSPRPQTRVEKYERDGFSGEGLGLILPTFETPCGCDQMVQLPAV